MTTFREYREAMRDGTVQGPQMPMLPSDVQQFQGERAGFVTRMIAAGIDVLLVFLTVLGTVAVIWMASFIINPSDAAFGAGRAPKVWPMVVYGYILNVLYWTIGWSTGGRTIGNLIMGVRVVNFRGDKVRWAGGFLRALFCTFFPIGLLWVIVSGANRSVQDVVMRTSVIYDWVIGVPGLKSKPPVTKTNKGIE